jgi:tetratricopeptide (TPR) repeat protein
MESGRYKQAEARIRSAIDINPINGEYYALLALCMYNGHKNYSAIQMAAKSGLSFDPENNVCKNVLAMIELRRGRKEVATKIMDLHLEDDPENALSLANQGWNYLHQGNFKKAEDFFDKALIKNPDSQWAAMGQRQVIKSGFPIYRWLLWYFLKLSRVPISRRFTIVFGIYALLMFISFLDIFLSPFAMGAAFLYAGFIYTLWLGETIANFALMFTPKGKSMLKPREKRYYVIVLALLLNAGIHGLWFIITRAHTPLLVSLGSLLFAIPVSIIYQEPESWRRKTASILFLIITFGLAALGAFNLIPPGASWLNIIIILTGVCACSGAALWLVSWLLRKTNDFPR